MPLLSSVQLKELAKAVLELEKEELYGEAHTDEQRLSALERLLIDESRGINGK